MIGYICKSSENLSFAVYRFQQAEITLIFLCTYLNICIFYTTAFKWFKHSVLLFSLQYFCYKTKHKRYCWNTIALVFIVLHMRIKDKLNSSKNLLKGIYGNGNTGRGSKIGSVSASQAAVQRPMLESGTFFRGKKTLLHWFKKRKLSVTCERMGTKYW